MTRIQNLHPPSLCGFLAFCFLVPMAGDWTIASTVCWNKGDHSQTPDVVFMRPLTIDDGSDLPMFQVIDDADELEAMTSHLKNESARLAFTLFELAQQVAGSEYPFFIAIVEGGNNASQGFRLKNREGDVQEHRLAPYIKLDPLPDSFRTTLLHESGHMIFSVLSHGKGIPTLQIAPMFHTTSAITDRGTAFNEGFAEHLEAIAAHFGSDRASRAFYGHRRLTDDSGSRAKSGFYFPISDMSNYAQNFARYQSVRDNQYSFENSATVPDYNRIQLSPTPDLERLRSPAQLVASEGFCATYFFWLAAEQLDSLAADKIEETYRPVFEAIKGLLNVERSNDHVIPPYLTDFLKHYGEADSELRKQAMGLLYQLSHGAFFDTDYRTRWQEAIDANYRLNVARLRELYEEVERNQQNAIQRCLADMSLLDHCIGEVVPLEATTCKVRLPVAFGDQQIPLTFDANTVPTRVLALLPGISQDELDLFAGRRDENPFIDFADLRQRGGLSAGTLDQLKLLDLSDQ